MLVFRKILQTYEMDDIKIDCLELGLCPVSKTPSSIVCHKFLNPFKNTIHLKESVLPAPKPTFLKTSTQSPS